VELLDGNGGGRGERGYIVEQLCLAHSQETKREKEEGVGEYVQWLKNLPPGSTS
jgi:hypothetical protein